MMSNPVSWCTVRKIAHQTVTLLSVFSILVTSTVSVYAQQIIIDPSAPGTTFRTSGNGTPQIDIAAPTQGVSVNQFSTLNVNQNGLILNNSTTGGVSIIGANVTANPNFVSGPASTIIGEVTGGSGSSLSGDIEVFGQSAAVVISNPNGISCNGCAFLNTTSSTLTTGKPIVSDGKVDLLVERGTITIGPDGFNPGQQAGLFGRHVNINGPIATSDDEVGNAIVVSGGAQRAIDLDFGRLDRTSIVAAPSIADKTSPFAIDAGSAGTLTGGYVEIRGNEAAQGVNLYGNIKSHAFDAASAGDLFYKNVDSKYWVTIVGQDVRQYGDLFATRNVGIHSTSFTLYDGRKLITGLPGEDAYTENNGSVSGRVIINADDFVVIAGEVSAEEILINVEDGSVTNTGFLMADGDLEIIAGTEISQQREVAREYDTRTDPALQDFVSGYYAALLAGGEESDLAAEMLERASAHELVEEHAEKGATITGTNITAISKEGFIANTGGTIAATQNVQLSTLGADGYIWNRYLGLKRKLDASDGCTSGDCGTHTDIYSAQILAGRDITLEATGDVFNVGSDIGAAGDVEIAAGGRFIHMAGRDIFAMTEDIVSPEEFPGRTAQLVSLNGDISVVSEEKLDVWRSKILSGGDLTLTSNNGFLLVGGRDSSADSEVFESTPERSFRFQTVLAGDKVTLKSKSAAHINTSAIHATGDLHIESTQDDVFLIGRNSLSAPDYSDVVLNDYKATDSLSMQIFGTAYPEDDAEFASSAKSFFDFLREYDIFTAVEALRRADGGQDIKLAAQDVGVQGYVSLLDSQTLLDIRSDALNALGTLHQEKWDAILAQNQALALLHSTFQHDLREVTSALELTEANLSAFDQAELANVRNSYEQAVEAAETTYQDTLSAIEEKYEGRLYTNEQRSRSFIKIDGTLGTRTYTVSVPHEGNIALKNTEELVAADEREHALQTAKSALENGEQSILAAHAAPDAYNSIQTLKTAFEQELAVLETQKTALMSDLDAAFTDAQTKVSLLEEQIAQETELRSDVLAEGTITKGSASFSEAITDRTFPELQDVETARPLLTGLILNAENGNPVFSNNVSIRVAEETSADSEVQHWPERVGYAAFNEGPIRNSDGEIIGVALRMSQSQFTADQWTIVDLADHFDEGTDFSGVVVTASPLSYQGPDAAFLRLWTENTAGSSELRFRIDEWQGHDDVHLSEEMHFIAMLPGDHELWEGTRVHAGSVTTGTNWTREHLDLDSGITNPIVFANINSLADGSNAVVRVKGVSNSGFDIRVQEAEDDDNAHSPERVGFIAVQGGTGIAAATGETVDHEFTSIDVHAGDVFLATMQTANGPETANLRWKIDGTLEDQTDFLTATANHYNVLGTPEQLPQNAVGYAISKGNITLAANNLTGKRPTSLGVINTIVDAGGLTKLTIAGLSGGYGGVRVEKALVLADQILVGSDYAVNISESEVKAAFDTRNNMADASLNIVAVGYLTVQSSTISTDGLGGNIMLTGGDQARIHGTNIQTAGNLTISSAFGDVDIGEVTREYNRTTGFSNVIGELSDGSWGDNHHLVSQELSSLQVGGNLEINAGTGVETETLPDDDLALVANSNIVLGGVVATVGGNANLTANRDIGFVAPASEVAYSTGDSRNGTDIYDLQPHVTDLTIDGDFSATAGDNMILEGAIIEAGGTLQLNAEKDVMLSAAQEVYQYNTRSYSRSWFRKKRSSRELLEITYEGTDLASGGQMDIKSQDGNVITAGATLKSETADINVSALAGDILVGAFTDIHRDRRTTKRSFFFGLISSSSSDYTEYVTNTGSELLAGLDLSIISEGNTELVGAQLSAGRNLKLNVGGDLDIRAAIDSARKERTSQNVGLILTTTVEERSHVETAVVTTLNAAGDMTFSVGGVPSITLYDNEGDSTETVADLYPDELTALAGLVLLEEDLVNEYFYDETKSLSPAFTMVLTIALTQGFGSLLTSGSGVSSLTKTVVGAGGKSTVVLNHAGRAVASMAASTTVGIANGTISGDLDLAEILKSAAISAGTSYLTSSINLKAMGNAEGAATAANSSQNALSAAGNLDGTRYLLGGQWAQGLQTSIFGDSLTAANVLEGALDSTISAGVQTAVHGGDFGEAFRDSFIRSVVSLGMVDAQKKIGDIFHDDDGNPINGGEGSLGHVALHGFTGCIAAELQGADCGAGAAGAIAGAVYSGMQQAPEEADYSSEAAYLEAYSAWEAEVLYDARNITLAASFLFSGGEADNVATGSTIGASAVQNNYLTHEDVRMLRREYDKCAAKDGGCTIADRNELIEKYNALSDARNKAMLRICGNAACIQNIRDNVAISRTDYQQIMSGTDLVNDAQVNWTSFGGTIWEEGYTNARAYSFGDCAVGDTACLDAERAEWLANYTLTGIAVPAGGLLISGGAAASASLRMAVSVCGRSAQCYAYFYGPLGKEIGASVLAEYAGGGAIVSGGGITLADDALGRIVVKHADDFPDTVVTNGAAVVYSKGDDILYLGDDAGNVYQVIDHSVDGPTLVKLPNGSIGYFDTAGSVLPLGYSRNVDGTISGPNGGSYLIAGNDLDGKQVFKDSGGRFHSFTGGVKRPASNPAKRPNVSITERRAHHQGYVEDISRQLQEQGYVTDKTGGFYSECGSTICYPDITYSAPGSNKITGIIEVKTGNGPITANQFTVYDQIGTGDAMPGPTIAQKYNLDVNVPMKEQGYPNGIPVYLITAPGLGR